ncbi:MAG: threonine synthase [Acidimicrobiales bacterium]
MNPAASRFEGLECLRCGAQFTEPAMWEGCPVCRDGDWAANLVASYDLTGIASHWDRGDGPGPWRYRPVLPVVDESVHLTLGEGDTPLVRLAPTAGWDNLWLKDERANPTWSYKDRLNVVAVAKGVELGAKVVGVSSSGNHGASASAYAARAGLATAAFTRDDVDPVTATFMQVYGATVVMTSSRGRWRFLSQGVRRRGWYPVSTYTPVPTGNPYGVEGYKVVAFEIFAQLGVPDVVVVPTCYGEGLAGIWAGFDLIRTIGLTDATPRMVAVEPALGGPLSAAYDAGADRVPVLDPYPTIAGSIASTVSTDRGLLTVQRSRGAALRVGDEEMTASQHDLARAGIFLEVAGAAGHSALPAIAARLDVDPASAVCVVIGTAGGLREVRRLGGRMPPVRVVAADADLDLATMEGGR